MESLGRLIPFVIRQRFALIAIIMLSMGNALFSMTQLALVYPATQLLMEGKTFSDHVREKLESAREEIEKQTANVPNFEAQLAAPDLTTELSTIEIKKLRRELHDARSDLRSAKWNEFKFGWLETHLIPWLPSDKFNLLAYLLGTLLVLTLLKEVCGYFQEMSVGSVVQRVMQSLRERLFRSTLKLDQQTLALETTPQLMSRFTFDLTQVAHGMVLLGGKVVVEPLKLAMCVGFALYANWRLTALAFVFVPVLAMLFGGLGRRLKLAAKRQMESMSRLYRVLEETLTSFRIVQAFRNERLHRRRLANEHRAYFEKAMRILRIDAMVSPSVEFLAMCAVFIASLPGAYLVLRHKTGVWGIQLASEQMTVSDLGLLYTCMLGVLDPGRKLSSVYSKLKKSATACARVFEWMDRESLVQTPRDAAPLPRHHQSIEFDRVTFHYAVADSKEQGRTALNGVSLRIPFGATVAVVGSNGSGKSTLINLLPRFYDPHAGSVRVDGIDLRTVDPRDVRCQMGIVTQETLLFDWSIAENIRYGRCDATDEEIQAAAHLAHVTDFVAQLPEGMATQIGTKGHRLSGGQRQRVALARAIVRDPAILILDEATSAIDAQSEQCIHQTLREFASGRTTFIITHAMTPSLLACITHVLVMDTGQAIAFGEHESILKTCPRYRQLFDAQTLKRAG